MAAWSFRAGCCAACWANSSPAFGVCTVCLWVGLGCSMRRPSLLNASCSICTSEDIAVFLAVCPALGLYSWWQLPLSIPAGMVWRPGFYEMKAWICCIFIPPGVPVCAPAQWKLRPFALEPSPGFLGILFLKITYLWVSVTELSWWEINNVWICTRSTSKEISCKAVGNTLKYLS